MKKFISSIGFILTLTFFGFLNVNASNHIIKNSTELKTEDRDVKDFNGIAAGGPIKVIITMGNTEGLKFEGDAEAIATLITEVRGNILIIRPQNSWTSWAKKYENKKITAYVNAKTITSLTMSGDGGITVNGKIDEQSVATTLSGSGFITANITANDFTGTLSGSGKLNIAGNADKATLTISGSGAFGNGFSVDNLTAVLSGSGKVTVNATNSIDAVVSGSGNINYSGNPTVQKRIIGSGKVQKI